MTLDQASKISQIWGIYLEYVGGKLVSLFGANIPESFLPFPKKTLEEALNIVAEHHHNMGNQDTVKALQATIASLLFYTDDEQAILKSAELFNNLSWRKAMLPAFKEFQKTWIKTKGTL